MEELHHRTTDSVLTEVTQSSNTTEMEFQPSKARAEELVKPLEIASVNASPNNGKVIYLGVVFMLLYSAFNPVQNLMSMLFQQIGEEYLGIFALLVLSQSFAIGSLLSPRLAPKLSFRSAFTLASLTFVFPYRCRKASVWLWR